MDAWHRRRCPECRAAFEADAKLRIALDAMRAQAEAAPGSALRPGRERVADILQASPATGLSNGARAVRRIVRWISRTTALATLLALALCSWTLWLDRDPHVSSGAVRLPSPNAFRYSQEAGAALSGGALVRSGAVDEMAMRLPNMVAADAQSVGVLLPRASVPGPAFAPATSPPDVAEAARLVEAYKPALTRLREGLKYPYAEPMTAVLYEGSSHLAGFRSLARLLALDGYVKLQRGKPDEAVAAYLDIIRFGIACQNGAPRAGRVVGITIEEVGRAGLWAALPDLDAETAAHSAVRLQDIAAQKPPLSAMFEADRQIGSAMIVGATGDRLWRLRGWTVLLGPTSDDWRWWQGPVHYVSTLPMSRAQLVRRYIGFVRGAEDQAKTPYPRPARTSQTAGLFDFFGRLFLDGYDRVVVMNDLDTAQNELLAVALAARSYRLRNDRDAPSIRHLVDSGVLRRIPTDPFDPIRKPLRYVDVLGEKVIYSIGPDARDDAGVPAMPSPNASGQGLSHPFTETTVGDIVAGKTIGLQFLSNR